MRGEEHFVFVFDPKRRTELLRLLGRYAADPSMSFNWYDAAVLSQKIRDLLPASSAIEVPVAEIQETVEAKPQPRQTRRF